MEPERVSLGLPLQSSGGLLARCGWCRNTMSRRKARHGRERRRATLFERGTHVPDSTCGALASR